MDACGQCRLNADLYPEAERVAGIKWLRPAADPPKCLDFQPVAHASRDTTHSRL